MVFEEFCHAERSEASRMRLHDVHEIDFVERCFFTSFSMTKRN